MTWKLSARRRRWPNAITVQTSRSRTIFGICGKSCSNYRSRKVNRANVSRFWVSAISRWKLYEDLAMGVLLSSVPQIKIWFDSTGRHLIPCDTISLTYAFHFFQAYCIKYLLMFFLYSTLPTTPKLARSAAALKCKLQAATYKLFWFAQNTCRLAKCNKFFYNFNGNLLCRFTRRFVFYSSYV